MNEINSFFTFQKCFSIGRTEDGNVRNTLSTLTRAGFILSVIGADLLLMLSLSDFIDFIFGIFLLPIEIYLKWKSNYLARFETKLTRLSIFPRGFHYVCRLLI